MPDTMTFTKVFGSLCGALLVFLLGKWAAEELYHVGGHYGEEQAYVIDTGEEDAAGEEAPVEEETPFVELLASASAEDGAGVFRQCSACHVVDEERNGAGPHLVGIMGREIGAVDGFNYSGALPEGEWTWENMSAWIENPREFAPGTSMAYNGLADDEDRADLIAYLGSYSEGWSLPSPDAAVEEAAAEAPAEEGATEEAAAEEAPAAEEPATEEAATEEAPAAEEAATEEAAAEEAATEEAPAADAGGEMSEFQTALASADPGNGEGVFRQCRACHVADQEQNRVGPHLVGVVGREKGAVEGFRYSGNLPDGEWTPEALNQFLENPRDYAPGTSMAYAGLRDVQDRADLIAWLDSLDD